MSKPICRLTTLEVSNMCVSGLKHRPLTSMGSPLSRVPTTSASLLPLTKRDNCFRRMYEHIYIGRLLGWKGGLWLGQLICTLWETARVLEQRWLMLCHAYPFATLRKQKWLRVWSLRALHWLRKMYPKPQQEISHFAKFDYAQGEAGRQTPAV